MKMPDFRNSNEFWFETTMNNHWINMNYFIVSWKFKSIIVDFQSNWKYKMSLSMNYLGWNE